MNNAKNSSSQLSPRINASPARARSSTRHVTPQAAPSVSAHTVPSATRSQPSVTLSTPVHAQPNPKRVGIVTLTGSFNYGNRLQLYATCCIYEKLGYAAEALVLKQYMACEKPGLVQRCKNIAKALLGRQPTVNPHALRSPGRATAFRRFGALVPERVVRKSGDIRHGDYALFSCGSDQVWNPGPSPDGRGSLIDSIYHGLVDPGRARRRIDWYYLGFSPREKRVALAPSIGIDSLEGKQVSVVKAGVENFDRLSVREKRGAELIEEFTGRKAVVICDPTLVLTADEWRAVSDARVTPAKPYVLAYLLGGVGEAASQVLDKVTHGGDVLTVPLSDHQKPGEPDAGPAEFISLIDNAAHVVTDSFHAAVFSCILQTPLTIVRREGGASMFSRLEGLAEMLGIQHKIYGSPAYDPSRAGDYIGVPDAIAREREKFMGYLEGCLNAQPPSGCGRE